MSTIDRWHMASDTQGWGLLGAPVQREGLWKQTWCASCPPRLSCMLWARHLASQRL